MNGQLRTFGDCAANGKLEPSLTECCAVYEGPVCSDQHRMCGIESDDVATLVALVQRAAAQSSASIDRVK